MRRLKGFLHWRSAAMIGVAALAPALWAQSGAASATASVATADSSRALVNEYCLTCHSQELATAGVVLEGVDFNRVANSASVLERVLRKIRGGEMPPPGMPR